MIWKIDDIIFVTSKADKYGETLLAEHNGQRYRIRIDKTMMPYYYEVFRHYYEGERDLHQNPFASSRRSRIEEWVTANLK